MSYYCCFWFDCCVLLLMNVNWTIWLRFFFQSTWELNGTGPHVACSLERNQYKSIIQMCNGHNMLFKDQPKISTPKIDLYIAVAPKQRTLENVCFFVYWFWCFSIVILLSLVADKHSNWFALNLVRALENSKRIYLMLQWITISVDWRMRARHTLLHILFFLT